MSQLLAAAETESKTRRILDAKCALIEPLLSASDVEGQIISHKGGKSMGSDSYSHPARSLDKKGAAGFGIERLPGMSAPVDVNIDSSQFPSLPCSLKLDPVVKKWLEQLDLGHLRDEFMAQGIDSTSLGLLSHGQLQVMVPLVIHLKSPSVVVTILGLCCSAICPFIDAILHGRTSCRNHSTTYKFTFERHVSTLPNRSWVW